MTSRITSLSGASATEPTSAAATSQAPKAGATAGGVTPSAQQNAGEAATITSSARASAALLEQARAAPGVDQHKVASLAAAVQAQTYAIPAHALANSIVSGLAEAQP